MTPDDGRKRRLRRAFDAAASDYDRHGGVQRLAAERLSDRIAGLPLPQRPRILEIGCGTGFLSEALRRRLRPADWLVTDLSPAMLAACRARLGAPADTRFEVLDADGSIPEGGDFDLICSSLAFQWLEDLPGAADRLAARLRPSGWLAFATLAAGSLESWRRAHLDLDMDPGTPEFPSVRALAALAGGTRIEAEWLLQPRPGGRALIEDLKGVGAGTPVAGRRPLDAGSLRRVMRRFEANGGVAAYHVAHGLHRRPAGRGVFVTGTDTGVGKTVVSAVLARAWDADYWKPVQTGLAEEQGDTVTAARLADLPPARLHPPAWALQAPVSPHLAASAEGAAIDVERLDLPVSANPIVVEGAGGPLVPLGDGALTIDLMVRLDLPVVVAAANRLGAISHTLLVLEAVRARGLKVLGVVLTGGPFADNRAAIEAYGHVKVLAELPWAETLDAGTIADWAELMPPPP